MLPCIAGHAQFSADNSFMRKEIVSYKRDWKGFFVKHTNMMVDRVTDVVEQYAYDKKAQNLYVLTGKSNVIVTLTKDYAKIIKRNKDIPQLTGELLNKEIEKRNALLENRFSLLNHEKCIYKNFFHFYKCVYLFLYINYRIIYTTLLPK